VDAGATDAHVLGRIVVVLNGLYYQVHVRPTYMQADFPWVICTMYMLTPGFRALCLVSLQPHLSDATSGMQASGTVYYCSFHPGTPHFNVAVFPRSVFATPYIVFFNSGDVCRQSNRICR
jgi:hypothetical protein